MFSKSIYYGYIVKGDLHGAIHYVKQFPDQSDLYNRFMALFEQGQYITYEADTDLNNILLAYQQYYRDAFYLRIGKEEAADKLRDRLAVQLGITDKRIALCDLEQSQIAQSFESRELRFLGGETSGYYGPYVWRTTETVSYDVELPGGIQTYAVKLLDGFVVRSWMDYLSFGEIGPGGWTDDDGYINCVKSAWDFNSESFRVSLLKHEAQHARDLETDKNMSSENLEYRAKLVELIYSRERNLLKAFAQEADSSDKSNGHAMAAHRIIAGFADALDMDEAALIQIPIAQIQATAMELFRRSGNGALE